MKTGSASIGSHTKNPYWDQQFDLRQFRILRGAQPIADFDAADKCRLYVTTMKAKNFQDDIQAHLADNFKEHFVIVLELTSTQDANENCH